MIVLLQPQLRFYEYTEEKITWFYEVYQAVTYLKHCLNQSSLLKARHIKETKSFGDTSKFHIVLPVNISDSFIFGFSFRPKLKTSEILCK